MRATSTLAALLAASFATACVDDPDALDADDAAGDDVELSDTSQEIVGSFVSAVDFAGVVQVVVSGQADTRTGLSIGGGLVVSSNRWFDWATVPGTITATAGAGRASPQPRVGVHTSSSAYFPLSIVQSGAFTGGHANTPAIDARTSAQLQGAVLRCYEYVGTQLRYVDAAVIGTGDDPDDLRLGVYLPGALVDADAGAVCVDLAAGTAVAMVTRVTGGTPYAERLASMSTWFDGMRNLAATRNDSRSARMSLYTVGAGGERLCLDVPWGSPYDHAPVNVFPCHYGPAQRLWMDQRVSSSFPRFVLESSGRCMDAPGAQQTSGLDEQQYGCHSGTNQQFELTLWGDAQGGWKLRPLHARSRNLCLSVDGGVAASGRPTEQRTCTGSADQRWFPRW